MLEKGFLSGYKTYIAAGVGVIVALAAFASGVEVEGHPALDLADTAQVVFTALVSVFLRQGVAKGASK